MKCKFCGADVRIGERCEYCKSYAEPSFYPEIYQKDRANSCVDLPQKRTRVRKYIVKKGDSLWSIAKAVYGSGEKYTKILNANRRSIKDAYRIRIGQELKIPLR